MIARMLGYAAAGLGGLAALAWVYLGPPTPAERAREPREPPSPWLP